MDFGWNTARPGTLTQIFTRIAPHTHTHFYTRKSYWPFTYHFWSFILIASTPPLAIHCNLSIFVLFIHSRASVFSSARLLPDKNGFQSAASSERTAFFCHFSVKRRCHWYSAWADFFISFSTLNSHICVCFYDLLLVGVTVRRNKPKLTPRINWLCSCSIYWNMNACQAHQATEWYGAKCEVEGLNQHLRGFFAGKLNLEHYYYGRTLNKLRARNSSLRQTLISFLQTWIVTNLKRSHKTKTFYTMFACFSLPGHSIFLVGIKA